MRIGWMAMALWASNLSTTALASVTFDRVEGGGLVQLVTADNGLQFGSGSNINSKVFSTSPYVSSKSITSTGSVTGSASLTVTAQFTSASSLTATFSPNIINLQNSNPREGFTANIFNSFTYYFTVDKDTLINLDYDFDIVGTYGSGKKSPVLDYGLARQVGYNQPLSFVQTGQTSGKGSVNFTKISAGSYYAFLSADLDGSTYPPADTSSRITSANGFGKFTLVQSAIPEPNTWAMLILGFGVVGGVARWRRRAAPMGA